MMMMMMMALKSLYLDHRSPGTGEHKDGRTRVQPQALMSCTSVLH